MNTQQETANHKRGFFTRFQTAKYQCVIVRIRREEFRTLAVSFTINLRVFFEEHLLLYSDSDAKTSVCRNVGGDYSKTFVTNQVLRKEGEIK